MFEDIFKSKVFILMESYKHLDLTPGEDISFYKEPKINGKTISGNRKVSSTKDKNSFTVSGFSSSRVKTDGNGNLTTSSGKQLDDLANSGFSIERTAVDNISNIKPGSPVRIETKKVRTI